MARKAVLWILVVLASTAALADGVVVYKSTGPDGKVSYTDHPPASSPGHTIEVLLLPAGPDDSDWRAARERVQAELEASRDITDRMAADRREREEARRQAAREREARTYQEWLRSQSQPGYQAVPELVWGWPAYGYSPGRHPGKPGYPGYPGRPDKPGPKPGPRTPSTGSGSGSMSASDLINRSRPW